MAEIDGDAPGWDAIEGALRELYPAHGAPRHFDTSGGEPPNSCVWGVSAYQAPGHWHLLTLGLSELWSKQSHIPETSGWGFELTMRVPLGDDDTEPAAWAVRLLKVVGDSVYRTGKPLAEGSRLEIGAPVTMPVISSLQALVLTRDLDLPTLVTPNGRMDFLQIVGITQAELEQMRASSTEEVLDQLRVSNPRLLTDPSASPL